MDSGASNQLATKLDWKTKIILIGDTGVGKTALMRRFMDEVFSTNYSATIGNQQSTGNNVKYDYKYRYSSYF